MAIIVNTEYGRCILEKGDEIETTLFVPVREEATIMYVYIRSGEGYIIDWNDNAPGEIDFIAAGLEIDVQATSLEREAYTYECISKERQRLGLQFLMGL